MRSSGIQGYVLAGGASRRFGSDKALAEFDGESLLRRISRLIESAAGKVQVVAPAGRYREQNFALIEDRWPDEGPLGGIITALQTTQNNGDHAEWNLIVSCDMPFLTREWLEYMQQRAVASECEVVVPRSEHGLEPLCACWKTAAAASLQETFAGGTRKVTEAMKRLRMEVLDGTDWKRFDNAGRLFWNMNTAKDYETALGMWKLGKS